MARSLSNASVKRIKDRSVRGEIAESVHNQKRILFLSRHYAGITTFALIVIKYNVQ